eukprot:6911393-Ditylum_brightwellii.AAC.1
MASKTTITTAVEATSSSPPMTRAIVVDVRDRYRPKQEDPTSTKKVVAFGEILSRLGEMEH